MTWHRLSVLMESWWAGPPSLSASAPRRSDSPPSPFRLRRGSLRLACRAEAHAFGEVTRERRLVTQTFASWNQLDGWLRRVEELRRAAW